MVNMSHRGRGRGKVKRMMAVRVPINVAAPWFDASLIGDIGQDLRHRHLRPVEHLPRSFAKIVRLWRSAPPRDLGQVKSEAVGH